LPQNSRKKCQKNPYIRSTRMCWVVFICACKGPIHEIHIIISRGSNGSFENSVVASWFFTDVGKLEENEPHISGFSRKLLTFLYEIQAPILDSHKHSTNYCSPKWHVLNGWWLKKKILKLMDSSVRIFLFGHSVNYKYIKNATMFRLKIYKKFQL